MTLVPLKNNNFIKNKINNTIKVNYKNSDLSTYVTDNNIDSKSILNTNEYNDITFIEANIENNNNNKLDKVASFASKYNIDILSKIPDPRTTTGEPIGLERYSNKYFHEMNNDIKNLITNDNLKLFNFRNYYGIERIKQKFLPQSFELQKKTYVKNSLYRDYNSNFSLDHYKNLEYGFCNWNTINFFSQKYDENVNHANCIIWPNTKNDTLKKHQYEFTNSSFNVSFYFNLRKQYANFQPECVFHVPDVISIYFVRYNDDYKIAITLGNQTKFNLKNVNGLDLDQNIPQDSNEGFYYSSGLNISNNTWYNLSLNVFKNSDSKRTIDFYLDGSKKFSFNCNNLSYDTDFNENIQNSFICIGNKPVYRTNDIDYDYDFYYIFAREFNKDISLGKNNVWQATGSEEISSFDKEEIYFEEEIDSNSESFHGELHDLRIYGTSLDPESKITENCNITINNVKNEIDNFALQFYVPVHYIPSYTNKKSAFNADNLSQNLKFSCIYNPVLSNTCGGLEVTAESYLIDFVNHSKPNIVIGAKNLNANFIYQNNVANSLNLLIKSDNDVEDIKKGEFSHHIYNKNFNSLNTEDKVQVAGNNLTYRNLLILPNDNGIQKVRFDAIVELLNGENYDQNKFDSTLFNSEKPFNVSVENIYNLEYFNTSRKDDINDTSKDVNQEIDLAYSLPGRFTNSTLFKINNDDDKQLVLRQDLSFNLSNIMFHDTRINDTSSVINNINNDKFTEMYNRFNSTIYTVTKSNPVTRVYKENIEGENSPIDSSHNQEEEFFFNLEYKNNVIQYIKFPLPYSVLNRDFDSMFINIFDISSKMYNKKINKNKFTISDNNLNTTNSNVSIELKDNSNGGLYRSNCLSKVADWNYVGHLFYKEGIVSLNRPDLYYFGESDFECSFNSDFSLYVHEVNIPADIGLFDNSENDTYNEDLRHDESAFNSEESFVYITDINLHDENLNVIARAKLARPAPKKKSDSILFRLKMDY
tara:strand:+ start:4576 stop:7530 length:2955 start_codon:yes stop_codon:yes gene_type:complete